MIRILPHYHTRVTIITLAAFSVGICSILVSPYLLVLQLLIYLCPQIIEINHQSVMQIGKYTSITLIFGVIDGLCIENVRNWNNDDMPLLSVYLMAATVYYYFQFQFVNNFHHNLLTAESFLIYHSAFYTLANSFAFAEHLITKYFFEFEYKMQKGYFLVFTFMIGSFIGQSLRIAAFFTAKSNFTHLVSFHKKPKHQLVTHGIYSVFRHPSYTGFFYYSVFGQLYLGNFISAIGFFIALVRFFDDRIYSEQYALMEFFAGYPEYKKKTYILIPFVKDPPIPEYQNQDQEQNM